MYHNNHLKTLEMLGVSKFNYDEGIKQGNYNTNQTSMF